MPDFNRIETEVRTFATGHLVAAGVIAFMAGFLLGMLVG